jgi:hypothetical protein
MSPHPSNLADRLVPSTGWTSYEQVNGVAKPAREGGIYICPNVDTTCFTIRQVNQNPDEDDDLIHICDWAELRATIDQFMADRAAEAEE